MIISTEDYLEAPYWVIDILPKQVPAHSSGQYFRIDEYYRSYPHINALYRKFTNILLKLNCYEDMAFSIDGDEWKSKTLPDDIETMVSGCLSDNSMLYILLPAVETMITLSADDTYMTVYNPNEETLELLSALATSEGFFLWKPEQK